MSVSFLNREQAYLTTIIIGLAVLPACYLLDDESGSTDVDTNTAPEVEIIAPPAALAPRAASVFTEGEPITLVGKANDDRDGKLSGAALIWILDGSTLGTGSPLVTALLRGVHWLTLSVSDGDGLRGTAEIIITVLPPEYGGANRAPEATITSPAAWDVYAAPASILLEGSAVDPEEGVLPDDALQWYVRGYGSAGTGPRVLLSDLPPGVYTAKLTARDSYTATDYAQSPPVFIYGTASCAEGSVSVTPNPVQVPLGMAGTATVSIAPLDAGGVRVRVEDGRDAIANGLDGHGVIPEFAEIYPTQRQVGAATREVSLLARNDVGIGDRFTFQVAGYFLDFEGGYVCRVPLDVEIVAPVGGLNLPPTASIADPLDGAVLIEGRSYVFRGSAIDPEKGPLAGPALAWTSDRDGAFGSGANFRRDDLSVGTHVITLTATDEAGLTGSAVVTIEVAANTHPS